MVVRSNSSSAETDLNAALEANKSVESELAQSKRFQLQKVEQLIDWHSQLVRPTWHGY